jgi:hypothetical protein
VTRSRRLVVVAISTAIALVAAVLAYGTVKPTAAASAQVFIDTAAPSVVHRPAYPIADPVSPLVNRGEYLGRLLTSAPTAEQIARRARVPSEQLAAEARMTGQVQTVFKEPGSEERASQIRSSHLPYRLEVEARQWTPIINIYTRAPSTAEAVNLAKAAVTSLERLVDTLADDDRLPADQRIVLRQLGTVRGGPVKAGMAPAIGVMTFLVVLGFGGAALADLTRTRRRAALRDASDSHTDDLWPHTTRLMPWMFAGFLAMLWLVPFDRIMLDMPTPIDLTLDRIVLPAVVAVWLLALLVGGRAAPRLRWTAIHLAVAAFVACAFISVISNAGELNQALELDAALKRLPLLVSYAFVFVIASTGVRRGEVRAFMTYILMLASICALGVLWEYRFSQNLFSDWSDKLLPGIFSVGKGGGAGIDELGRRLVQGPAMVPLETVAMLAMALPIPLVRLTQAEETRKRVLYGLAACLLFAGAFATFRKSGLLAPLAVIATIAYYRRRELLKLAPVGLAVLVLVPVLAPGAVATTIGAFSSSGLGSTTVSDRTSDYDAIRPDVWTNLLFGRGWGTYDHTTYRILDSEVLHRLIEMGVFGLLAYVFMIGSVVVVARSTITERDRTWAPLALIGAAGAVSFGVVSTLYDTMSFPHGVYIFLCTAGLVAAVVARRNEDAGGRRAGVVPASRKEPALGHVGLARR